MKGIYSALINTFKADGSLDLTTLKKVIDHNIDVCGIDGLYVNGSTGESFNMPLSYRLQALEASAEYNAKRVSLIAQIGCNVVEEIYELADKAYECGYEAVSAVAPFYFAYSADEIMAHYLRLAELSKLPIVIYNIPVRTSVVLSRANFKTLLAHENIVGVKFTSNDFYLLEGVRNDFPDKILFSGFDEMLLSATVLKTNGAIGSTYNVVGHWAKKVFESANVNDLDTARVYQRRINKVVELMLETNLIPTLKAVFSEYGIECGSCRLPFAPVNDIQRAKAKEIYEYIKSEDKLL